ncbi:MAG: hypothetical protein ACP5KA_01045 [Desulfurococcaceae archaeon]|jgi:hypothetical protein
MSVYRPHKGGKKAIEEALKDLDPATRELARAVLENLLREERFEEKYAALLKKLREREGKKD